MSEHLKVLFKNLPTSQDSNSFIKSFESYVSGSVAVNTLLSSYPFLKEIDLETLKKSFGKVRTELLSRKKVKIYTPVTVSSELIKLVYTVLTKYSKSEIVIESNIDSGIVAGIKFNLDGKIFNLTLENINSIKNT